MTDARGRSQRPLRVLHVLHHIYHYPCGYRTRTEYVLRCQQQLGFDVSVVTSADHEHGSELPDPDGLIATRTAGYHGSQMPVWREWRLMRALEQEVTRAIHRIAPDVVHAHSPSLVSIPAWRAARRAGIPLVYEVRDLWENAAVDLGRFKADSLRYRAARGLDTLALRGARSVVAICETMRRALAARTGAAEKIFVVANGVDLEQFNADGTAGDGLRARLGLEGRRLLAYVGTFQPYEGLDLLISAMPEIVQRRPDAHLLIVGHGTDEVRLKQLISDRRLESMVTLAGRFPHDQVRHVYSAADLLVYPRHLTRTTALTTPLKPLEAMAMGAAVVGSDVPALKELIDDGRTGLLFRAGDRDNLVSTCVSALADDALRLRLGAEAAGWVRRERSWKTVAANYLNVYGHAMSHQNGRS